MMMYRDENSKVKRVITEKTWSDGTISKKEDVSEISQNEFGNQVMTITRNEYNNNELINTEIFTYERVKINPIYLDVNVRNTYDVIVNEMTRPDKSCLRYTMYINKITQQIDKTEICNWDSSKKRLSKKIVSKFKQGEDTVEVINEYDSSDALKRTTKTVYDKYNNIKSRDINEKGFMEFINVTTKSTDITTAGNYTEYLVDTFSTTSRDFKPEITFIQRTYKDNELVEEIRLETISTVLDNTNIEYSTTPHTKQIYKYDDKGNRIHTEHYIYCKEEDTYKLRFVEDKQYDEKNRLVYEKKEYQKVSYAKGYNEPKTLVQTIEYID